MRDILDNPWGVCENARRGGSALTKVGTTLKIAIVDDDRSVRRSLARLLGSFGLSVTHYASAEEFLASRNGDEFALLIVDLVMAEMTGLELLERLAESGESQSAIILTAHDTKRMRDRARRLGAPVLQKPVEGAVLLATVGRVIGRTFPFPAE